MAVNLSYVKDITTTTKFSWTVKIVVLEKYPIRESTPKKSMSTSRRPLASPTKYQWIVIADAEGTRVQLTIFGRDIDVFEDNLVIGKKYLIFNCKVSYIEENNRPVPFPYQWTLGTTSLVKLVPDNDDMCFLNSKL